MVRHSAATALGCLALLSPLTVHAETLYFKNKRAIQADSWQIKGHLIYLTMGGKTVYMKADSVDWDTTERLKQSDLHLEKADYGVVDDTPNSGDEAAEGAGSGAGSALTAADLRKVGSGYKMRRSAAPTFATEVLADAGWVDTGVTVRAGQTLGVRITGRISVAEGRDTGPEGLAGSGGAADGVLSDKPHGALLAKVGSNGDVRVLGRATSFTAPTGGRLYLTVNDKTMRDNSGAFTVYIELPTAPATGGSSSLGGSSGGSSASTGSAPAASGHKVQKGMLGAIGRAQNSSDAMKGANSSSQAGAGAANE